MKKIQEIERRIEAIEKRNNRVELDKAWEISWTRRVSIAALTYGVVAAYLIVIGNDRPFLNAAVPAAGFILSTLFLRQIHEYWNNKNR